MLKVVGKVTLTNSSCYQDFIGILLNNGYVVEIEPINQNTKLEITIKKFVIPKPYMKEGCK
ncbi:MAG: hypothetical protein E7208_03830 [Clostridium butyricum]|nr:hypothetical protein [Clostridium butyricum]